MAPPREPPHVLREYALIADGERGAIVGPRGEIAWLCFPRWESDAVLAAFLGGPGSFRLTPRGRFVWGGYYEEGTLIWRSRWVSEEGVAECREALAYPGERGRALVLRSLAPLESPMRFELELTLAPGFGGAPTEPPRRDGSTWVQHAGPVVARLDGAGMAEVRERDGSHTLTAEIALAPGERLDLALELSGTEAGRGETDPATAWRRTEDAWRAGEPVFGELAGRRDARHAYAVLRGLTSSGRGMVAAATTSLPERAERGRNYDYRYAWIRDQAFAGLACAAPAEPLPLLDDAVAFVAARLAEDGPALRPAYTTYGEPVPEERELPLPGYPGAPAWAGNRAGEQFQLDVFGDALLLFAAAAGHGRVEDEHRRAAAIAAAAIAERRHEPDAGIWETEPRLWTHSRLNCVAGLRAWAPFATSAEEREMAGLADAILAECRHRGTLDDRWRRAPDDDRVDCALLLPALRGAVAPDDPLSLGTLEACLAELTEDGYTYRFRPDDSELGEEEGAFLLCGFLVALALDRIDRPVEAARFFERTRAACGPPGLFSEEFDVRQRQLRANLPQAFVHALALEAAIRISGRDADPIRVTPGADAPPSSSARSRLGASRGASAEPRSGRPT